MKLGTVDSQGPALQPWADQFGNGATVCVCCADGDADRGGGAVGVAVIDRPAGVALFDVRQEPHLCGCHIDDGAAFWPAMLWAGDQPVVAQLLAFSHMCVVGGRGDRPDSDDACVGWHRGRARAVADPEHGDVVVPGVVAVIDLVGEPTNSLQTRGRVEVGGGAAIVAVPGGEQGGLTVGVVDEPSGGAGVHGQAVGVVDAYADTWGQGGRRVVAQVEVWWVCGGGRSSHYTAAADCRCGDRRPRPRCRIRHSPTGEPRRGWWLYSPGDHAS